MNKETKKTISLKPYLFESSERTLKRWGGGVGILLSQNLNYCHRHDLEQEIKKSEFLDVCVVELYGLKVNTIVVSMYHPPNTNNKDFLNQYKKFLNTLSLEKNKHILIGMDHNYDLLKSSTHSATRTFLDFYIDSSIWLCITKPTRITKSSATLIDNIFVSNAVHNSYISGILLDDISDHLPCLLVAYDLKLKGVACYYQ